MVVIVDVVIAGLVAELESILLLPLLLLLLIKLWLEGGILFLLKFIDKSLILEESGKPLNYLMWGSASTELSLQVLVCEKVL